MAVQRLSEGSLTPWQPQVQQGILQTKSGVVPPLHPLCPTHALCLPSGTALQEIKFAGGLARTARASLWGMRPAAQLVLPGAAGRHVPTGQAGLRARKVWDQGGGLEGGGGQWANLSAFPSFLPMSGRESASFPQTCAYIRTNIAPHPQPLPFPGLWWRLYQGIENVLASLHMGE